MMNHVDFLMEYVRRKRQEPAYKGTFGYLELGCDLDQTFSNIDASYKVGVDPIRGGNVRKTSNEYFASIRPLKLVFNLIFIDGDHSSAQVEEDIDNSLEHLAVGGLLVLHDVLPPDASYCAPQYCNDAWRAFLKRCNPFYQHLDVALIPVDYGVGLIRYRDGQKFKYNKPLHEVVYDDYVRDYVPQIKQLSWEQGLDW